MITTTAATALRGLALSVLAGILAACGGGHGGGAAATTGANNSSSSSSSSNSTGGTSTSGTGIWSGALMPDDTTQAPPTGWLVIGTDGSFRLDTDQALFMGHAQIQGQAFSATATAYPYTAGFADGASVTFNGTLGDSGLTGTYSGGGTMQFQYEGGVSTQTASQSAIAGTYHGELWIKDSRQSADITVGADGSLAASTSGGCAVNGKVAVADTARNAYSWSGQATGCATDGAASGMGFLIENDFIYLSGTIADLAIWMGGSEADTSGE